MFRGDIPFVFWINLWYQQFNVIFLNFKGFFQRSIFSVETTCQPFGKIQPSVWKTQNLFEALNQGKLLWESQNGSHNMNFTGSTPLKINMSSENQWLEDVFPIEMVPF